MSDNRRRIVMVGSALDVRGGVSAMARVCESHGLFARTGALYLASHCDGSVFRKLARAAGAYVRFRALLLSGRVSLLHVHLNSDASFWRKSLFVAAARRAGIPYILHVHCGNFGRFVAERAGARGQVLARRMLREAAAVIALSPQGKQELEAIAPGIAVDVIPNPVDLNPQPLGTDPVFQDAENRVCPLRSVVFLGGVTEAKGAFDLLRAWVVVAKRHPKARLVMAGSGDIDRAKALAAELGIGDRVEFPGWVSGADKDALLAGATVFVLPSHAEAMPMAVLEAMAAGIPVVATEVGGVPWMLEQGECGQLVPPRDLAALAGAIDRFLADPALGHQVATAARERVERDFAAGVVVPRLEALWARMGNSCQPTPAPGVVPLFAASAGRTTPNPPR